VEHRQGVEHLRLKSEGSAHQDVAELAQSWPRRDGAILVSSQTEPDVEIVRRGDLFDPAR
jgi:hypothetical protein